MVDTPPTDVAVELEALIRDVSRATYGTVVLADCEPEFSRVLEFVRARPQARAQFVGIFRHDLSGYITRFCMRHLQWQEIVEAARERMREEIHNSEYESLQKLLAVYEPVSLSPEAI
ncbi:MAG: hypothetical protein QOG67_598 [Verrucomicrobiota bacterium]|jgi:hypothetical protein